MKRILLVTMIAVMTALVCAFGLIACTDEESPDLSSVNGTYELFLADLDDDGNVLKAEIMGMPEDVYMRTVTLKDGKYTQAGQSADYTLRGENIVMKMTHPETGKKIELVFEKVADGVYVEKVYYWNCLIKEGATAPFPLNRLENDED